MQKLLLLLSIWLGGLVMANAQTRHVTGKITDNAGAAVPYATIQIKGTKVTSVADAEGNFTIKASPGDILVITSSGVTSKETTVPVSGALGNIVVTRTSQNLSEVVVTTALGIKRQARELGYATTQIKTAELNQAAVVNPATGLAAKVAGVDVRLADNGVNPQVKVTFRGSRSIEGNNAALIVVDGIPVDQQYLANINPNEIDDITILKGSNAAALYGMAASNGVMVITTKKGKGKFSLTYQNVVSAEHISYFPSLQNEYSGFGGEGGSTTNPATGGTIYFVNPLSGTANTVPFENESFGVAYSSLDFHDNQIPIGVDQNGKWYFTPFKAVPNGRKDFFVTGVGDQNELSGGYSNKWGGLFFSGDHTSKQGVVPYDTYQRNGGRINGNATWGKLSVQIGASYYNVSTNIAGNSYYQYRPVYYLVVDQLASTDLKSIKDISKFQNNQGFVNAYAPNPWWSIFNSRSKSSQDQLLSHVTLSYKINDWLTITGRTGYSRTMENAPSYIDSITFPSWLLGPSGGGLWNNGGLANFPGNNPGIQREVVKAHYDDWNTDAFLTATKTYGKFKFNLIAGGNYRARTSWGDWYSNQVYYENVVGANFIPSYPSKVLHNDGSADAVFSYKRYDQSAYGDLTIGYDRWLFLHGSFRNDWTSILAPQDRSFSYPSVDLSAVLSDKLSFLQNSSTISFLKVRLGYAGTGNVSLDNYQRLGVMGNIGAGTQNAGTYNGGYTYLLPTFGAYAIYPIAATIPGFPFGNNNGYSQSGTLVQNGLKPEKTTSAEVGFQLGLLKNRINLEVNYYDQQSTNQTIPLQASTATGITSYLTNAGKVDNSGVEIDLSLNPVFKSRNFRFDLSGNFAYTNSKVVNIAGGAVELDQINFGQIQLGGIYAIAGKSYPQILVTDFQRDPQGHIIVGASSGLPTLNPNPVDAGNANFRYFLGLSPSFGYKGLTLKAVFDYRGGAKILNEEGNVMDFTGIYTGDATNRQAFIVPNSVIQTSPGKYVPNTNVPITSVAGLPTSLFWWANYYNQAGMPYVTSAAFWKLREVALSYSIPMRIFGKQDVLKQLDVSLIGRNLFMWRPRTNNLTDPEFSTNGLGNAVGYTTEFQTPPTRVFSASIRATIF
jgi:TonB-linked SusC/RagA family outer membrane protein